MNQPITIQFTPALLMLGIMIFWLGVIAGMLLLSYAITYNKRVRDNRVIEIDVSASNEGIMDECMN